MKIRKLLVVAAFAFASVGIAAPSANACDPGDPNCHPGCEAINNTPIVNKIAQCST